MGQGRLLGLLPHGSMGYGTADLPPLCPVPPGTGVLQVCSASGTVSVAVLGAELQAQGALAEPTEVLVVVVQEQGHHSEVPQSCLARVAGGSSPLPGHSTVAQPRGAPARSHLHMCPQCAKARFASSCPAAGDSTRGTQGRQEQPAPPCHRQFCQKKQKDLGVSRTGDTAPDTIPRWEQRRCRGRGTCQAVCEGQSPSLVHWGPQGWGREAAH